MPHATNRSRKEVDVRSVGIWLFWMHHQYSWDAWPGDAAGGEGHTGAVTPSSNQTPNFPLMDCDELKMLNASDIGPYIFYGLEDLSRLDID